MQYLILASPSDRAALSVAAKLRQRYGDSQVGVISPEALGMAPFWEHRSPLETKPVSLAPFSTTFRLAGGTSFCWLPQEGEGNSPQVIFNRLTRAQAGHFDHADPLDRDYAQFETFALWLSWLHSLKAQGVALVNQPSPRQLCGPGLSQLEWLALARRCALPVIPLTLGGKPDVSIQEDLSLPAISGEGYFPDQATSMSRILAAGPHLVPGARLDLAPAPSPDLERLGPGIARLQRSSGCPLLELYWVYAQPSQAGLDDEISSGWRLASANPLPELNARKELDAVVELLAGLATGGGP